MSNHVSNIDPPIMLPLIPRRTSVMAKKELFDYPLLGKTMRLGSLVPVDRGNRDATSCRSPVAVSGFIWLTRTSIAFCPAASFTTASLICFFPASQRFPP